MTEWATYGDKGPRTRLVLVEQLKMRVAKRENYRDVAEDLEIPHSTAYKAVSGQTWKHVKPYGRVLKQARKPITARKAEAIRLEAERTGISNRKLARVFKVSRASVVNVRTKDSPAYRMQWKEMDAKRAVSAVGKYGVERVAERLGVSQFAVRTLMERDK